MDGKRVFLSAESRRLVLNALNYFENERRNGGPVESVMAVQKRTAECLKISERTVKRVVSMSKNCELEKTHTKNRRHRKSTDVPNAVKIEVRNVIYGMYKDKKHITLNSLLKEIVEEKKIWEFRRESLRKLIRSLGFSFKKTQHRVGLCEQSHVVRLRQSFLKEYVRNLDSESPWDLLFQDETWIFSKGKYFILFRYFLN